LPGNEHLQPANLAQAFSAERSSGDGSLGFAASFYICVPVSDLTPRFCASQSRPQIRLGAWHYRLWGFNRTGQGRYLLADGCCLAVFGSWDKRQQ